MKSVLAEPDRPPPIADAALGCFSTAPPERCTGSLRGFGFALALLPEGAPELTPLARLPAPAPPVEAVMKRVYQQESRRSPAYSHAGIDDAKKPVPRGTGSFQRYPGNRLLIFCKLCQQIALLQSGSTGPLGRY